MKEKSNLCILLVILALTMLCGCSKSASTSISKEYVVCTVAPATDTTGIDGEEATQIIVANHEKAPVGYRENASGQTISVYAGDDYLYYVVDDTNDIIAYELSDERLEDILANYSGEANAIPAEYAVQFLLAAVDQWFSEYDTTALSYSCRSNAGSPIEYYTYTVEEIVDNTRVNEAIISLAYDGTLTSFYGTHNRLDMFDSNGLVTAEDALNAVFDFITVNSIPIDIPKDINPIKVMYKGNVVWSIEIEDNTSENDSSVYSFLVDAETGELVGSAAD